MSLGKGRYKIGISYDVKKRHADINRSIPGSVRLVTATKVFNVERHEKRLHNKFSCSRFTFRGSGKTEWFRLNWLELALVIVDVQTILVRQILTVTGIFVILVYLLIMIL